MIYFFIKIPSIIGTN